MQGDRRAALQHDATPPFWLRSATLANVTGVEAFLRHRGGSLIESLKAVHETAAASRLQVEDMRRALRAAVDARCGELIEGISVAESKKYAALERSLVEVDSVLDRWRADRTAVLDAAALLTDADMASQHTALARSLTELNEQPWLQVPSATLEPANVGVVLDVRALLGDLALFGRILAPRAIAAAEISVVCLVSTRAGIALQIHLALDAAHAAQSPEELSECLSASASAIEIEALLCGPEGGRRFALHVDIVPDFPGSGFIVSLGPIEAATLRGSVVSIIRIDVAGASVAGLPISISVVSRGVHAPLLLDTSQMGMSLQGLSISPDGVIVVPDDDQSAALVFGADGTPLDSICLAPLGLSNTTRWASFYNVEPATAAVIGVRGELSLLLLADRRGKLVAVSPALNTVTWSSVLGFKCGGIATLSRHGVVVVALDSSPPRLQVHSLADGSIMATATRVSTSLFVASDSSSGAIFVGDGRAPHEVHQWIWQPRAVPVGPGALEPAGALAYVGLVEAAGTASDCRALAVMPPVLGKFTSHLVVGTLQSSELLVLSLPALALVCVHALVPADFGPESTWGLAAPVQLMGLAADPCGNAIVVPVCDGSGEKVPVLPWPLSGMLPLE